MHDFFYRFRKIFAALAVMPLIGCGYYSFSGSTLPHLKTVAVPIFENETAEFGIKEEITDVIIARFTDDNTLKIADSRTADSIVSGKVIRVEDRAGAYTRDEKVEEIQVYVTVQVAFEDLKKRKVVWEGTIREVGTYIPGDAEKGTREAAISEAIEKIAEEVLNRTVTGW